ncbi:MAG: helicase-related protein [Candidatus Roizmanbacteria bacterium]
MSAITNQGNNTLSFNLKSILPQCDRIDALVGYFYFSGFNDLYKELQDKQIRILVGMDIDSKIIEKISSVNNINLDSHTVDTRSTSRSGAKEEYLSNFIHIFNETDHFDNDESQKAFEVFIHKIADGSLQIKKTIRPNHSKIYILHNNPEFATNGITPGIVIEGSSNLTFSGLKGQGEHNRILQEKHYYEDDVKRFEEAWSDPENIVITDLHSSTSFISEIKNKIWLYSLPDPLLMYYRVLYEYFGVSEVENMKTPGNITGGKFTDLKYQKDAINMGIDRINKFGGVIIADVVGLGKSIIASAIAHNLGKKTIVIAPPHLEDQWNDYMSEFDFKGFVYTTGKIDKALERHREDKDLLIILDEAHKHRNEDTESYTLLHQLCAGHPVMALSATPFNNDPKDIYALIKLFSTPGHSTIRTVENLSMSFHLLFKRYKKVRKEMNINAKSADPQSDEIIKETHAITEDLRLMIEPLIIRRSRLDLEEIEDYRNDLKMQGVSFAKVKDPELLEYDLGSMTDLYVNTLEKISPDVDIGNSFVGARYKPAYYLRAGSTFIEKLIEEDDDEMSAEEKKQRLIQGQSNIAKFMRRLLVRRFESSIRAFSISINNMITSSELVMDWYANRNEVPIFKKGMLPSTEVLESMEDAEQELLFSKLEGKGLIQIPVSELQPDFITALKKDIRLLKEIKAEWENKQADPKYDFFKNKLIESIRTDSKRKIIIFTEFSDTANYVYEKLIADGVKRVFKYSSSDASKENKRIIQSNFDAGLDHKKQTNDFDVIVATDAISEGFNLHRAGSIINYDIPYNPTRVIQRVGRINRINKKVFDQLYIYNFFPTVTGEQETHTKAISTLKMDIIHTLLGEDTKTLTSEEDLKNYFAKQYRDENSKSESQSWDAPYYNTWKKIKDDPEIMKKISAIPLRARIARKSRSISGVVTFAKKSGSYIFAFGKSPKEVKILSPEFALPLFNDVEESEKATQTTLNFEPIYQMAKEHIFKENTKAPIDRGRREDAINKLRFFSDNYSPASDLCKDLIKVIRDYDALPYGMLKDIIDIRYKEDYVKAVDTLKEIVPTKYLDNIFRTAERANDTGKLIVLSEELVV